MDQITWIYLVVLAVAVAAIGAIIYASVAKTRWGISFAQVICPRCRTVQPRFRKPADAHEGLWGGYTCAQCGTKLDKWGRDRSLGST